MMQKIMEGVDDSEKVTIKLSRYEADREIIWEEHREFRYKGQFYDVIESEQLPDSVYFVCYWDKEETFISEVFEGILFEELNHEAESDDASDHFVDLIKTPYRINSFKWAAISRIKEEKNMAEAICLYRSVYFSPPNPPPKSV